MALLAYLPLAVIWIILPYPKPRIVLRMTLWSVYIALVHHAIYITVFLIMYTVTLITDRPAPQELFLNTLTARFIGLLFTAAVSVYAVKHLRGLIAAKQRASEAQYDCTNTPGEEER